jgi:hypothetical protein
MNDSYDDILNIFASEDDQRFQESSSDGTENVLLKFHSKGVTELPAPLELAKFLNIQQNLTICGFTRKPNSVLFEISKSDQLNNWLVKLFEERHSNMSLTAEKKTNILGICKGKFNIIINGTLVFLVLIPNVASIEFPCHHNIQPYGLGNGKLMNIVACNLRDEPFEIVSKFLSLLDDNSSELKKIYGIRLEYNDETDTHNLRFLIMRKIISNNLLSLLKNHFSSISFSGDTFHIIPSILKTAIDKKLLNNERLRDFWKITFQNDILLCTVNEMTIIDKPAKLNVPSNSNNITGGTQPVSHQTSHDSPIPSTSRSIFDRLMPRNASLANIEEMNLAMGFRKVSNSNAKSLYKPKIKSVIGKINRK